MGAASAQPGTAENQEPSTPTARMLPNRARALGARAPSRPAGAPPALSLAHQAQDSVPINLGDLPLDLLRLIAQKTDVSAFKAMRLTSKTLAEAGESQFKGFEIRSTAQLAQMGPLLDKTENLQQLRISHRMPFGDNELRQLVHALGASCGKLEMLDFDGLHHVTDAGLEHLSEMKNLKSLNLSGGTHLTNQGLRHLQGMTAMESLRLDRCGRLTGSTGLQHLKGMTAMQSLNLNGCDGLTDVGLSHLAGMKDMRVLSLNHCVYLPIESLEHFSGMKKLESLELCGCAHLNDEAFAHLADMTAMRSLDLMGCSNLTNEGFAHFADMTDMRSLRIAESPGIDDSAMAHIGRITSMQSLHLIATSITAEGVSHLSNLTGLKSLFLADITHLSNAQLQNVVAEMPLLADLLALNASQISLSEIKRNLEAQGKPVLWTI